jgi:threonine/homoserine efflux transporter RhtA
MRNADLRFWTLEHILMMIIALVLAHVGRALAKKANDAAAKHKRLALFFTAAMLLVIIYIPWARPFFRLP